MLPIIRRLVSVLVLGIAFVGLTPEAPAAAEGEQPTECCKVCHKGKACGDSCIAREKNCTKGPGCACDGE